MEEVDDALRESEERYRTLFEQAPVGVFIFDREPRITECNRQLVTLLKSSYTKIIGLELRKLKDQAILPGIEKALEGEPAWYEGPYTATTSDVRVDVSMRLSPLRDAQGEVVGGLGVVEDISARNATHEALRKSEERFRSLIERAPDAIAVVRDNRFLYVNPALAQLLGYDSTADIIGRETLMVVHPDDHEAVLTRRSIRQTAAGQSAKEYRVLRRDGDVVVAEVISMPIEYDGAPAHLILGRDITERKLMHLRLLQADRMVAVGTLAAGVAHEINNPLSYVLANLDMLADHRVPEIAREIEALGSPELADRLRHCAEMVRVAREGAERVRGIVRDLRSFSRADDDRRDIVDIRSVLDASISMAWNEIRHRARLVKEYEQVTPFEANEARLTQVFLNLLLNAAQALPEGGAAQHAIRVRVRGAGDSITVEVGDTGQGISEAIIKRIFDPFFTTKPIGVGTGLGLWICQGIVQSLGGEISVRGSDALDDLGVKTTFSVHLPARPVAKVERPPEPMAAAVTRRGRVLVVDDEVALARALRSALSAEHDVDIATSGNEAMAALANNEAYDVVLCDLMMPEMTGMDLWEQLRREGSQSADNFIFVTGGAFTPRAREFLDSVANECLEKPFNMQSLRALLRSRVQGSMGARA